MDPSCLTPPGPPPVLYPASPDIRPAPKALATFEAGPRTNFELIIRIFSFLHTGRVFVFRIEFLIMCSLHNMYWTGFWRRVTVASLSFRSVAFQDDGVASRMETVQR